jgi:hypothetical protein
MHFNHCGGFFETVQHNLEIHDNTIIDFRSVSLYYSTFFLTEDVVADVYAVYAILIIPLALPVTNITGQNEVIILYESIVKFTDQQQS